MVGPFSRSSLAFVPVIALVATAVPMQTAGQEGHALFPEEFTREEFVERRAAILEAIGESALAVVQAASGDHSSTRFRQTNQFYYLTGLETPNAYLLLDGRQGRTALYLLPPNPSRDATDGRTLSAADTDEVMELTGVDAVFAVDRLAEDLGRRAPHGTVVYTPFAPAEGHSASRAGILRAVADRASDPWDGRPTRGAHFVQLISSRFPHLEVRDLSPILDQLRLIKSPAELEMIRRASILSGEALMEAIRSTRPGVRERELDALARFIFVRHGAQGEAYRAIVASGPNAWFAHHRASHRVMEDGDLVLMDYCPDLGYYRCDVTRMWPVNGRFTSVQRELYGFYLAFYEAILYRIRPGVTAQEIKLEALEEIGGILESWEFSQPHYEAAARRFVEAYRQGAQNPDTRMGHWVGLSTHDPGNHSGPLEPGLVFVIEPQFRVPEEDIYIRLEDTIAITEDGAEILSDFAPRDMDAIESLMREPGILDRYPELILAEGR
jgi:Xaa-Pro aminopeptidase